MSSPSPSVQALHYPAFRLYLAGRILATLAMMMQSVAVGWQIYDLTHSPIALGYVGLAQFLPMMLCALPAGDIADRRDRRLLLAGSFAAQALSAAILVGTALYGAGSVAPFYGALALFGVARAFAGPASTSLVPRLVPVPALANAAALSSSAFQASMVIGPALGGWLYLLGPTPLYATCCVLFITAGLLTLFLRITAAAAPASADPSALRRVLAGIRFVRRTPVVLGAISLDLFAVLLGGATALLPVYASDILKTGPDGLGYLRAAPAIGAAVTGLLMARFPLERSTGPAMFAGVALFGAATILFGLSENLVLSLAALFVMGAADMVSVVIRWSLVQLATPDEMRGRVASLNTIFISASNELGEVRAGFSAALFGTVPAVIIGGLGTIGVVALWTRLFPELRKLDLVTDVAPLEKPA